jgi:hypothetical protein
VWRMDRGIPSEELLQEMRAPEREMYYLVGTPRGKIEQYEKKWTGLPWRKVRDSVEVKLFAEGTGMFVLAKSEGRRAKETAIRRRKLARLLWKLREAELRDGHYLLRTNLTGEDPEVLWDRYMQLTQIEAAFKCLKSDLGIRPIYPRSGTARGGPHLGCLSGVRSTGHAEAAPAGPCSGPDAARGAGPTRRRPNVGRLVPDHRCPTRRPPWKCSADRRYRFVENKGSCGRNCESQADLQDVFMALQPAQTKASEEIPRLSASAQDGTVV